MTTRIDRAQIEHVAQLASLILTDAEADRLTRELAEMVGYVDELNELDTSHVEPTASVQLERSDWRTDAVEPSLPPGEALAQAPRSEHGGFAVPTFVES
ncbi:Asp-tRNA(Asn)/Glu-tRNA(Gln) amidotransferase subunit GatC [Pendulispora albinea]|uniref:Aspartyl/glutamyl-tRNA(Asn/Gln) amidotransferase subunit C n=1 Tax=Pendulispora albinea TaxID=2741071 RepID=A0ABZ2LQB3_9BACT